MTTTANVVPGQGWGACGPEGGWLLAEGAPAFLFSLVFAHFDGDLHTLDFHRIASSPTSAQYIASPSFSF